MRRCKEHFSKKGFPIEELGGASRVGNAFNVIIPVARDVTQCPVGVLETDARVNTLSMTFLHKVLLLLPPDTKHLTEPLQPIHRL